MFKIIPSTSTTYIMRKIIKLKQKKILLEYIRIFHYIKKIYYHLREMICLRDIYIEEKSNIYYLKGRKYLMEDKYRSSLIYLYISYWIRRYLYGQDHHQTIKSLSMLVISEMEMKRYKKALKLNQTIYEIKKEFILQKDMSYYWVLGNFREIYERMGDAQKAAEYFWKCYDMFHQ